MRQASLLPEGPAEEPAEVIDRAVREYRPVALYAMFSGGNDSLAAAILASQHPAFSGCVHINTGIGVEATREYVRQTCADQGWPLREMHPPDTSYDDLVLRFGFPGPYGHGVMYRRLKERALRVLVRETKRHARDHVALVTGIRATESQRRMRTVTASVEKDGARVWVSPLREWTKLDVRRFVDESGIPRNPVTDLIHMSGECLCGAFAKPGEMKELELWFPETADRIHQLEERARAAGCGAAVWGQRPPRGVYPGPPEHDPRRHGHPDQRELGFDAEPTREDLLDAIDSSPLCSTCVVGFDQEGDEE